jgi:hypothetical protein
VGAVKINVLFEKQFVEEGGYSEQLAAARLAERRRRKNQTDPSDQSDPTDHIPNGPGDVI